MHLDRVAILVKRAALQADKVQAPILQLHDLTVAQYKFLKNLYNAPKDSVRVMDLENTFSMTHSTVIDILRVLEKKEYTTRIVNPQDARSKIVSLTDKAYAEQKELEALGEEMEKVVTENLTEDEKEQLILLLKKLIGEE
ncbi:MarR family transcriptional regulator [Streptococcus gallolyticus subsp. gallolyticus]|uniref:MarR family winged helix-turn-helix transcriptional regulator n=1 Tax=Streptococcus gallolyticus TaxID=315405 RepID=UPI0020017B3A|nr:MarR family transcriptional regulator [Streptococcus gallolyticus]MCY7154832.1 MarR family transcriptional regulator [Streptococcus gallolyticus subsp. gallolyticus]MCY7173715.1 MarR family transcriptional regulator [Streptococcus gallolyticus subsp. gallolyticus]MCY7175836.1 MarR family transcriptional regulator [Streptococcus gallolyticus subsp. gallolyticus]MCY7180290.1 MarR family transcriptional regulator [Streptococcus gallolyticus subsp. gallolyticus]MCY7197842.1 MarR family transcri